MIHNNLTKKIESIMCRLLRLDTSVNVKNVSYFFCSIFCSISNIIYQSNLFTPFLLANIQKLYPGADNLGFTKDVKKWEKLY